MRTTSAVKTSDCCRPAMLSSPLRQSDAVELARAFAALADPVRLRLISLLASSPTGEVCVCELTAPTGRSQPTVSHHLRVLAEAGLIRGEKRGRWVWYSVREEGLSALRQSIATDGTTPRSARSQAVTRGPVGG
jgi:ArsR family transcriptional regulator